MKPRPEQLSTINGLWGAVAAELLHRLGIRHVVLSPGSRSAPLAYAFSVHSGLRVTPVLDERSAGFFALGLAQRTGGVVALLCTSGTAAANYLPAVIEASESGWPLLVLTADRPPELRHCRAGQTIDQLKLFGGYTAFHAEAPVPENERGVLLAWRRLLAQAAGAAREASRPVHINCPFREPLAPTDGGALTAAVPFAELVRVTPPPAFTIRPAELPVLRGRGLIVAGPDQPADPVVYRAAVSTLAAKTGAPVFADVLSPMRHGDCGEPVARVAHYDTILRRRSVVSNHLPEWVVVLGELPTSKILRSWLAGLDIPRYVVCPRGGFRDATQGRALHLRADLPGMVDAWPTEPASAEHAAFWRNLENTAADHLMEGIAGAAPAFEGCVHALAAEALPGDVDLVFASSLAVRDAEWFWPASPVRRRVFFNRGANGIDGTVSTAMGVAAESGRVCLFCGDLAALHDAPGWLNAGSVRGTLVAVVINNGGGGIFEHLPVAAWEPPFEKAFATPQDADFEAMAKAFGVGYRLALDAGQLMEMLSCFPARGVHLFEIRTDRKASAKERRAILEAAADAVANGCG
ncbi:MAG: 2-succinyl-5-enolpyruvyl-6-hydroxy-3-cyclohexene-1-carboxylic-acid synthase [Opitutales bacterium]|nr:2-succinyl-5-enolpyruvyl-6-hydroxy-3-cyclohexene-1-carboxylic-acid synthase [Opitutales bacterium]